MRSLIALTRKDLRGYFDQPTGYILIILFLVVLSQRFFTGTIINFEASLRPLFSVDFNIERPSIPWLLVILIPASTMRLLAEEQRDGTIEILLTHPVKGWIVLLAKFLAGLGFALTAIVATGLIPLTLWTAGNLDWGVVVGQYIGIILLAASFVSIGLFTSSIGRNQIVAFILAIAVTSFLMVVGLEIVSTSLPVGIARVLQDLSPVTHFSTTADGLLELGNVLYFVALTSTFLSAAYLGLRSKTVSRRSSGYYTLLAGVAGMVLISLMIGWFGSGIGVKADLTEDRIHSLSSSTKDIVDGLDDLLTLKLFTSKDLGTADELIAQHTANFLEGLASRSDMVKFVHKFTSAEEGDDVALEAGLLGLPEVQTTVFGQGQLESKLLYLGLVMTYVDRKGLIQFIDTVDGLEYRVASLAQKMTRRVKKTIGFTTGHGEFTIADDMQILGRMLSDQYNVIEVLSSEEGDPDYADSDVLVVAGPSRELGPVDTDKLKNYIDGGGKVMLLLEPLTVIREPTFGSLLALPNVSTLPEFVTRYGVDVRSDLLLDARSNGLFPSPRIPYPPFVRVGVAEDKIAGNIETVLLAWSSPIDIIEAEIDGVESTPLLVTSPFAVRQPLPESDTPFIEVSPTVSFDVAAFEPGEQLVAVAVTGPAHSSNGESATSFRMVVAGDADWATDLFINQAQGANNAFLALNLIDWLAQEDALASVRSKFITFRQLLYRTKTQQNLIEFGNIAGMPMLFVVFGLTRFVLRRRGNRRVYRREE